MGVVDVYAVVGARDAWCLAVDLVVSVVGEIAEGIDIGAGVNRLDAIHFHYLLYDAIHISLLHSTDDDIFQRGETINLQHIYIRYAFGTLQVDAQGEVLPTSFQANVVCRTAVGRVGVEN